MTECVDDRGGCDERTEEPCSSASKCNIFDSDCVRRDIVPIHESNSLDAECCWDGVDAATAVAQDCSETDAELGGGAGVGSLIPPPSPPSSRLPSPPLAPPPPQTEGPQTSLPKKRLMSANRFISSWEFVMEAAAESEGGTASGRLCRPRNAAAVVGESSVLERMMALAVHEAGRYSFGVVAISVHVLSTDGIHLETPDGGFWVDPAFIASCPSVALSRLVDETMDDFLPPRPVLPGEGLSGMLWAETRPRRDFGGRNRSGVGVHSVSRSLSRESRLNSSRNLDFGLHASFSSSSASSFDPDGAVDASESLRWRDVTALAADPDQPPNPRLQLYAKAGIGYAAGVQFDVCGSQGIVVYMARKTADVAKLLSPSNVAHLSAAANLIGSICAFVGPCERCKLERDIERREAIRRVRTKVLAVHAFRTCIKTDTERLEGKSNTDKVCKNKGKKRSTMHRVGGFATRAKRVINESRPVGNTSLWLKKCRGSDVQPPPPMPWNQVSWTFFGSFVVFLLWSLINEAFGLRDLSIMRGSFGSVVAAQFMLMAAPASQPRNAFFGQVVAGLVCIPINYIDIFPPWVRTSLSPSLAIAAMAKLGVTHPSAGGDALLYASTGQEFSQWRMYGFVLFNYAFSIVMATAINNLSRRRQYPIYWGFGFSYLRRELRLIKATARGKKRGNA